ncbi:MAG TPA: sugar transferase [Rhizomicrobium sp.]|nr:sugar transferase [Rhizomicrobium sp.]
MSLHEGLARSEIELGAPTRRALPYSSLKRFLDILVSMAAILLCSPLLMLIAAAVRLDSPGPILFRQRRGGLGGAPFTILKFRTMTATEDGPEVIQAQKDDPRITRIGHRLRPFFLDELPQLFNVLRGEMSLVGPRPHALVHDIYFGARIEGYSRRYTVKPGITGWAQIHGARGQTPLDADMQARTVLDLWYVEHANFVLDLLVLIRTPFELFRRG